jgi:hypothetical protein
MSWDRSPLDAVNVIRKQANGQVVLVLQGGGALGAYQGGVYEAIAAWIGEFGPLDAVVLHEPDPEEERETTFEKLAAAAE